MHDSFGNDTIVSIVIAYDQRKWSSHFWKNPKLKFLVSTSHSCCVPERRETAIESVSKNNRHALRLCWTIPHDSQSITLLPIAGWVHEPCGTGLT